MGQENIRDILNQHFPKLLEEELKNEIEKVGKIKKVDRGEILIDLDEAIDQLPLIYKGSINVHREDEDGSEILLYYVEAGSTCAQSLTCCMSNKRSNIRAEAEDDTFFISIPIEYLETWLSTYPSWKNFVLGTYAFRFEELLNTVDELAFRKLDERLIHYLKDKAKISGSMVLNVSHRQIAYDLNSSREVMSRLLKQLEKLGDIKLGRGKIELLQTSTKILQ